MRLRSHRVVVAVAVLTASITGCGGGGEGRSEDGVRPFDDGYLAIELPRLGEPGTLRLADFGGRPVIVNFFASWCAPCVREMPEIEAVKDEVGDAVAFVGIDVQEPEADGLAIVEDTGITWEVAHDGDGVLFVALEARGMPTTVLLDAEGNRVASRTGGVTAEELRDLIGDELGIEIQP